MNFIFERTPIELDGNLNKIQAAGASHILQTIKILIKFCLYIKLKI